MDILTCTVGDMRVALPFDRLAISAPFSDARVSVDQAGAGMLETGMHVVDLRRKFEFPPPPGEQVTRLIMIEIDTRLTGLIINADSSVALLRDVEIDTASVPGHPHILGVIIDHGEPAFLFDWEALLASETTIDLNELFRAPVLDDPRPAAAKFLDAAGRQAEYDDEQIRALAASFGIPLSVANRLMTFYTVHSESPS